jgi:hypothetical protein
MASEILRTFLNVAIMSVFEEILVYHWIIIFLDIISYFVVTIMKINKKSPAIAGLIGERALTRNLNRTR